MSEEHEGEDDVGMVLGEGVVLHGEAEVGSSVYCDDAPEVHHSYCHADEEGAHDAEHPAKCYVLKHELLSMI